MITKQTLFILGAGASKCYGYPTGAELKKDIIKNFKKHYLSYIQKVTSSRASKMISEDLIPTFLKNFDHSWNPMIDYYLGNVSNQQLIKIGKLSIALSLIHYEIESAKTQIIEFQKDDWFELLFREMSIGIHQGNFRKFVDLNKVSFITFNYDRSIEEYFCEAIAHNFGINKEEAGLMVDELNITHVFGRLPFNNYEKITESRVRGEYGAVPSLEFINWAMSSIKTLTERSSTNLDEINKKITEADRIFFLGFGYAPENMELLKIRELLWKRIEIYGTTKSLSIESVRKLQLNYLGKWRYRIGPDEKGEQPDALLEDKSCKELLSDYLREYQYF